MRCLIVDDALESREYLRELISPRAECVTAENGERAIQLFEEAHREQRSFDLIVLDVSMPGISGHDVFDRVRAFERTRGVPDGRHVRVLMVTGLWTPAHFMSAFKQGCEDYIGKPVDPDQLYAAIDALAPQNRLQLHANEMRRILIVDDDEMCRELVRNILAPYGACDLAFDGGEAVDACRMALEDGRPYDLILLDVMMPGTDGHAALTAIRKVEAQHGVYGGDGAKVIMTTALRDSKHCTRSFVEGCDAYVTKPIEEFELLRAVSAAIGAATTASA